MTNVLAVFRRPRPQRRFQRGVYLLPSMFTVANMFCGWACIVYAMRGEYATAAPLVAFAMILDILDGRVARLTGATSDFGVEFDSLADVISFGVAPAVLVFAWGLEPLGRVGWAVGFSVRHGHGDAPRPASTSRARAVTSDTSWGCRAQPPPVSWLPPSSRIRAG